MNTSRFESGAGKDNTSRILNNEFQEKAYATPLAITTTKASTLVRIAELTGAITVNVGVGSSTTPPNIGDVLEIVTVADATGRTVTLGTGLVGSAATLVLPASKKGYLGFKFDGVAWLETGRTIGV